MEYNDMRVTDKIKYINSVLSTANLTDIVKDLKTSKGTIKKVFEAEGYFYSKQKKQYLFEPGGDAERAEDPGDGFKRLSELDYINKRIDALEWEIVGLKGNAITVNKEINIYDEELTGELKVKSFKVYTNVLNSFLEFSATYKSIKKQDLISQALLEFISNHE